MQIGIRNLCNGISSKLFYTELCFILFLLFSGVVGRVVVVVAAAAVGVFVVDTGLRSSVPGERRRRRRRRFASTEMSLLEIPTNLLKEGSLMRYRD